MSNICSTDYTITGSSKDITKLEVILRTIFRRSGSEKSVDFNTIAEMLGSDAFFDKRGSLELPERDHDSISFRTKTPWNPMHAPIMLLKDFISKDMTVIYWAEQYNNGLFQTNDPTVAGRWLICSWQDRDDYPPIMQKLVDEKETVSEEDLKEALEDAFGKNLSMDDLVEEATRTWSIDLFRYEDVPINY